MNWLTNALSSSVGRKFVMGLTGLFLCFFLVIHLSGNLLLYVGQDAYDHYAHTLHEQKAFLLFAQVFLYTAFALHIFLALKLTRHNRQARAKAYKTSATKQDDRIVANAIAPETWMFWSGTVVLGFLILHLGDFKFELEAFVGQSLASVESPYEKASIILRNPAQILVYALGSIVLGVHVSHGFASAFQSLGANHPKYNSCIKWASIAFGWIVGIGFASFPIVWALTNKSAAP